MFFTQFFHFELNVFFCKYFITLFYINLHPFLNSIFPKADMFECVLAQEFQFFLNISIKFLN